MKTTHRRITPLLTVAATASLLIVGLAAPSSAVSDAPAVGAPVAAAWDRDTASDAALPDDLPEIGEVFTPVNVSTNTVCNPTWCTISDNGHGSGDPDGFWAFSRLSQARDKSKYYSVLFDPAGERLVVQDHITDGSRARADVVVTVPYAGTVLDRDTLYSSYSRTFNLGTPDGSGDIDEHLWVSVRVCIEGTKLCSPWVKGIA